MGDITKHIGMPYSFRRFNCWDYVVFARKDFGIKTKLFKPSTLKESFQVITAQMGKLESGLSLVTDPQNFDIVIVERVISGNKVYHCGIYHEGNVSHCCNHFGSVRYESFAEFKKNYNGVTLWR
jgi:hypothetical protein